MDMDGMGSGDDSSMPLNATGVDFSNATQAFNFLQDILDDTTLQIDGSNAAKRFWYGVAAVVGLAAVCNFVSAVSLKLRLRASHANHPAPCRPSNPAGQAVATTTAILREATYLQLTPSSGRRLRHVPWWFKVPPFGSLFVIGAYVTFILVLQFIPAGDGAVSGAQHDQALSVRAAWLAVAQMPLVVMLAGKNNVVGLVAGLGPGAYERLNVFHRWTARGMLLLATFHFGIESVGWNEYGLMQLEWQTDSCPPTGIAAYALLLWMNLTTVAPLRHLSYELFVAQHLVTFFGFVIALMMHLPTTALSSRNYVYVPIGLYVLDRAIRSLRFAVHNSLVSPRRAGRASLEALEDGTEAGGATRIRVAAANRHLTTWKAGSHVLLGIPRFGVAQSHPATILSTPTSHGGDLVFLLRAHGGFTRKLFQAAVANKDSRSTDLVAFVDGPYGGSHSDFAAFDTALLVAGGTGVTFALSILLSLAERAEAASAAGKRLPLRVVRFLWAIKNRRALAWITTELKSATDQLRAAGIEVKITIFVTCDGDLTDEPTATTNWGKGGCCCAGDGPSSKVCCCETGVLSEKGASAADVGEKVSQDRDSQKSSLDQTYQLQAGRPAFKTLVSEVLLAAEGETGIGACGPLSLTTSVRSAVVQISDERAVHKGSGAQGIYLHVEAFH
ncbi:ferric-chelate reductase Frp1 [Sporothrix curviconia]|uniref:ferric-chelate reductase (NADPH) n=1 Tax=Sporothrix curviconia TaxID=1260050 RepID=A0ABP0BXB1_9PEZI